MTRKEKVQQELREKHERAQKEAKGEIPRKEPRTLRWKRPKERGKRKWRRET